MPAFSLLRFDTLKNGIEVGNHRAAGRAEVVLRVIDETGQHGASSDQRVAAR